MGTESRPRAPGSTPRPAADGGKRQSRELTGAADDRGASTAGGAALAPSGCRRGPLPSGLRRSSSAWRRTSQSTCGAGGVPHQAGRGEVGLHDAVSGTLSAALRASSLPAERASSENSALNAASFGDPIRLA